MKIGNRNLGRIFRALFRAEYYTALYKSFWLYAEPIDGLKRYILEAGSYPCKINVRIGKGWREIGLYSTYDMKTLNEIFARGDYRLNIEDGVIVDFGSNIGLSGLYFLSLHPNVRVHLVEPVPQNIQRLKEQLAGFEDRYVLHECAIGVQDGEVEFATEPSGRFGGIADKVDSDTWSDGGGDILRVPCADAERMLQEILAAEGEIAALKIDVEGMEQALLDHVSKETLGKIQKIFVELPGDGPSISGFSKRRSGGVVVYTRLGATRPS